MKNRTQKKTNTKLKYDLVSPELLSVLIIRRYSSITLLELYI